MLQELQNPDWLTQLTEELNEVSQKDLLHAYLAAERLLDKDTSNDPEKIFALMGIMRDIETYCGKEAISSYKQEIEAA